MPAINSSDYNELYGASSVTGSKEAGPFVTVFITGQPREGQTPGTLSSIYSKMWDQAGDEKYLVHNATAVHFIPMFIKKIRKLVVKENGRDVLKYFAWDPDAEPNYPEGAKVEFIFAGALLDENCKPVKDKLDPERTAFVAFRNNGQKCGGAIDYLNALNKAGEGVEPLSDDPNFETTVVLPRRFICKATMAVGQKNSHGNTPYVFKYEVGGQVPDKSVLGIMEKSKKWLEPFETQYNLTSQVKAGASQASVSTEGKENVTFDTLDGETSGDTPDIPEEQFDLGI